MTTSFEAADQSAVVNNKCLDIDLTKSLFDSLYQQFLPLPELPPNDAHHQSQEIGNDDVQIGVDEQQQEEGEEVEEEPTLPPQDPHEHHSDRPITRSRQRNQNPATHNPSPPPSPPQRPSQAAICQAEPKKKKEKPQTKKV